ncbi:MAG: hypothetical protein ACJ71S_13545 [Acidobacteriaceae bacterium]
MSGAQACAHMVQAECGIDLDGQAGADADEVGDQLGVATGEAALAAELLSEVGAGGPLPPPVREAGVQTVLNQ